MATIRSVLVTGSAGHTGSGMCEELGLHYRVRGLDVKPSKTCAESITGSVTDLAICRRAVKGVDAVVISHMGPRPEAYEPPFDGFDINVKGAANIYHACLEEGITRVVLISSASLLGPGSDPSAPPGDCLYGSCRDLYPVTKMMQETLARYHFDQHGIITQVIRPSWIVYEADLRHKRGQQADYHPDLIDPADIAAVIRGCFQRDAKTLEAYTVGQEEYPGVRDTMRRLGWAPRHTFSILRARKGVEVNP